VYGPENLDEDLPQEIADPLLTPEQDALQAYMLAPVDDGYELAHKVRVMIEEQVYACDDFEDVLKRLAKDVYELARKAGPGLRRAA
jgi:hypothetical protein